MKLRRYTGFDGLAQRIHTDHGSHIEPPLDERWSDLDKLRWQAAVAEADTGLTINVAPSKARFKPRGSDRWIDVTGEYQVTVLRPGVSSSGISLRFHQAWLYISGVVAGAGAARVPTSDPQPDLHG